MSDHLYFQSCYALITFDINPFTPGCLYRDSFGDSCYSCCCCCCCCYIDGGCGGDVGVGGDDYGDGGCGGNGCVGVGGRKMEKWE